MSTTFSTPSAVDGFSRYFARGFDETQIIAVTSVFLAMFSRRRPIIRTDAEVVDIDIRRGNEKAGKFIVRGTVGEYLANKATGTGKYSSFTRKFPLSEETFNLTEEQLSDRMHDENPYENMSRLERQRALARDAYHQMMQKTIRAWEIAASYSALTGTQPSILSDPTNPDFLLDYNRNSDLIETFLAGEQFDNAAVDPLQVIDDKIQKLINIGKVSGQAGGQYIALMGVEAINGLLTNPLIEGQGDNRRLYTIEKNPGMLPPTQISDMIAGGAAYIAKAVTNRGRTVHFLTYDAIYEDDAGDPQFYMTSKSMLLTPITFRADRYFGPPDTLPMTSIDRTYLRETFGLTPQTPLKASAMKAAPGVIVPQACYTDAFPGAARKNAVLRVQSAPIFATTQTDALFTGNSVVS